MPTNYNIAFWNLENYFDSRNATRSPELQAELDSALQHWTVPVRNQKRNRLLEIITQMGNGAGPDLLGVCEVENRNVLQLLADAMNANIAAKNYQVAHADTSDKRGIDVAFIYDANLLTGVNTFNYFVLRRTFTRDIFQVNFQTNQNRTLVAIGNHWPSRSGGKEKSAAYRAMAGETLAYWHERILEELGNQTPVLVMGDLNDEPFDASVTEFAFGWRSLAKVRNASKPKFLNLMWPELGRGIASYYFNNAPNMIDHFMVNENMFIGGRPFQVDFTSVRVSQFAAMNSGGQYPSPVRFGGHGSTAPNTSGYSDHYPIEMVVVEAD